MIQPVYLPEEIATQFLDTPPGQLRHDLQPLHPHIAQGYPAMTVGEGGDPRALFPVRGGAYNDGRSYGGEVGVNHQHYQGGEAQYQQGVIPSKSVSFTECN